MLRLLKVYPQAEDPLLYALKSFIGKEVLLKHRYDYVIKDSDRAYEISLDADKDPHCYLYHNLLFNNNIGSIFEKGELVEADMNHVALNYGFPSFPMNSLLDIVEVSRVYPAGDMAQFTFRDLTAKNDGPENIVRVLAPNPSSAFLCIVEEWKKERGYEQDYYKMRLESIDNLTSQILRSPVYQKKKLSVF
jgi:hypothetical protein